MHVAPPSPPYVGPLPHTGGSNNKPIKRIVIHCTAGAEPGTHGAARGTADWTKRSRVVSSYHYVADSRESIQTVYDSVVAYHCGTNSNSIGYELSCSLTDSGRGHWENDAHQSMLRIAAKDVARLCLAYDVPITKVSPSQLRAGAKGICGHVDMRDAFGNTTHWDPGPHFPWSQFIDLVEAEAARLTAPPEPPKPEPEYRGVHLCLAGDWNEGPKSEGRWSPQWIARKGGMTVYPAPANAKGQHGIDYPMSSAPVTNVQRLTENVSDHSPIAFDVTHPDDGRVLHGCTFNVMRDRTPEQRAALVSWLQEVGGSGIDFFALQEVRQYHELLRGVEGYTFIGSHEPKGAEHNALLVRDGVKVSNVDFRQTSSAGWFTRRGGEHDPNTVALATLDGWLRVGSVHEVVSTDLRAGRWVGPVRRVAARISSARTLAKIGKYWKARR